MALVEATDHVAFFDDGVLKKQLVSAFVDRAASTTIKLLVRNGNSFVKKPWSDIRITPANSTEQFLAFRSGAPILAKSTNLSAFTVHPDLRPPYADLKQISISEYNGAIVFDDGSIKIFSSIPSYPVARAAMGQIRKWANQTWQSFERTLPYTYGDGLQAEMQVFPRLSLIPYLPTGGVFYSTSNLTGFFYLHNGNLYSWGEEVTRYWDNSYSVKYVPGSPIETGVSWLYVNSLTRAVSYVKNGVAYMRGQYVTHNGFGGNTYPRITASEGTPVAYAINNPAALFFSSDSSESDHVFAIANGQAYAAGEWRDRDRVSPSVYTTVWGTNHQSAYNNAGSANQSYDSFGRDYINNFQPIGGLNGQITKISTSGDHFLALNSAGTVYAWGRNNDWQCGRDSAYFEALGERDGDCIETPRTIKTGPPAVSPPDLPLCRDILALEDVSLAVDNSGNVWGWGEKRNAGAAILLRGLDNFDDYDNIYPTILPYFPANVETIELHNNSPETIFVKTTDKKIFVLTTDSRTDAGFYYTGRHPFTESYLHPNTTRWKIFRV